MATSVEETQDENRLREIGELFRQYTFDKKKPPAKVSDFDYLNAVSPMGLMALHGGDVIARSGVVIQSVGEGAATQDPDDDVIAYAKDAPTAGGLVLMHNRKVRRMTAEEFKAAKLAGDGDMAAGKTTKGRR